MEDFENSGEIALFGQDWLKWQHFFVEGTALYITAKLQGRRYAPNALDLVILDIQLLSEVRDTLVKRIVIDVPVDRLDVPMVESLAEIVRENPGNTELCFNINAAEDLSVNLRSASVHLNVNRRLLDFIESNEGISYRLE
jgi:DNA polymerase-3 subunit alpha